MRFGSVCSGIEAASVAWQPLGWKAAWFSEIEPFPSAVLAHHYPEVPNLGDMKKLPVKILRGDAEAPDVFCGGTPCQAFSVAGLRKSLDDARGNLSLTFCEIADAIDHVRAARGKQPAIIFWENVPGVLSTQDNAFGCFLAGLAGEDEPLQPPGEKWANAGCVYGPTRAVAWRTLDAQYFGLAQRRRRVFVVASARQGFDPTSVLFEWDGMRRDTAPSREAGKAVAGGAASGATECSHWDGDFPHPTLNQSAKGSGGVGSSNQEIFSQRGAYLAPAQPYTVANCLTQRMHKGINTTLDEGQTPVLAHSLRGEGFDASEDGTGWGTPLVPVALPVAFSIMPMNSGKDYKAREVQVAQPLMAGGPVGGNQGGDFIAQPVAFHPTQDPISSTDVCHAIGANDNATAAVAMRESGQGYWMQDDIAGTIDANMGMSGHANRPAVIKQPAMQVRRLTPVECERLQGFPDGYTAIPWRNKPASDCPDGPRYKALGNSWAVPVVRWIGKRIQQRMNAKACLPEAA